MRPHASRAPKSPPHRLAPGDVPAEAVETPEDVRRYVALSLGVAEPVAEELILKAGSRGANPYG